MFAAIITNFTQNLVRIALTIGPKFVLESQITKSKIVFLP